MNALERRLWGPVPICYFALSLTIFIFCNKSFSNELTEPNKINKSSQAIQDEDYDYEEDDYDFEEELDADPLYYWNIAIFKLNDRVYFLILKPISMGYKKLMPEPARRSILNFFGNIATPIRFANCLLQRKFESSSTEIKRFLLNTTFGFAGFRDFAREKYSLEKQQEDLGQTLAAYGIKDGCYLVLPIIGPSTIRDGLGTLGDAYLSPIFYMRSAWRIGSYGLDSVNSTSLKIGEYEKLKKDAFSPYDSIRDIYLQYRKQKIAE